MEMSTFPSVPADILRTKQHTASFALPSDLLFFSLRNYNSKEKMKAVVLRAWGGVENFALAENYAPQKAGKLV